MKFAIRVAHLWILKFFQVAVNWTYSTIKYSFLRKENGFVSILVPQNYVQGFFLYIFSSLYTLIWWQNTLEVPYLIYISQTIINFISYFFFLIGTDIYVFILSSNCTGIILNKVKLV